jgi:hypothetical protein
MAFFGKIFGGKEHKNAPAQALTVEELWHKAQELQGKKVTILGAEIEASGFMFALLQIRLLRDRAQGRRSSSAMRDTANEMFAAAMVGVAGAMQQDGNSLSDFIQINERLASFWNARVLPFALAGQRIGQIEIIEVQSAAIIGSKFSFSSHISETIRMVFEPILEFINL